MKEGLSAKHILILYSLQGTNQALGFITVPYLARTLGPEAYGEVAFAQGLVAYLLLLVAYGFDLSASRTVAALQKPEELREYVGGVVGARLLLAIVGFSLLFLFYTLPPVRQAWSVVFPLYGLVLAQALSLSWLFWGRGWVSLPLFLEMGQRLLTILGLFLWVREPTAGFTYALIAGTAALATSLAGWIIAGKLLGNALLGSVFRFRFELWLLTLKEGWWLFLAQVSTVISWGGNVFLLGLFAPPAHVAQYATAEKIVVTASALLSPLFRAFYPRFLQKDRSVLMAQGRKALVIFGFAGGVLSLSLYFVASPLVEIVFGPGYGEAAELVRVLAFWIAITALSIVYGNLVLVPMGYDFAHTFFLVLVVVCHLTLAFLMAPRWGGMGVAIALLASTLLGALGQALFLWRKEGIPPSMGGAKRGKGEG